jgi:hypothetical protein
MANTTRLNTKAHLPGLRICQRALRKIKNAWPRNFNSFVFSAHVRITFSKNMTPQFAYSYRSNSLIFMIPRDRCEAVRLEWCWGGGVAESRLKAETEER